MVAQSHRLQSGWGAWRSRPSPSIRCFRWWPRRRCVGHPIHARIAAWWGGLAETVPAPAFDASAGGHTQVLGTQLTLWNEPYGGWPGRRPPAVDDTVGGHAAGVVALELTFWNEPLGEVDCQQSWPPAFDASAVVTPQVWSRPR